MISSQVGKYVLNHRINCNRALVDIPDMLFRVIESKNPDYAIGDMVHSTFGWVTHAVCNGTQEGHMFGLRKIDTVSSVSPSTALGILGMPGYVLIVCVINGCMP